MSTEPPVERAAGDNNLAANRPEAIDYRSLFEALPELCVVLAADAPRFTVVAANDAWACTIHKSREEIIGHGFFTVIPEGSDPAHATKLENLRLSFHRVLATSQADTLPIQEYDLPGPASSGTGSTSTSTSINNLAQRFWLLTSSPVCHPATNEVTHIIHRMEDVTTSRQATDLLQVAGQALGPERRNR